MICDPSIAGRVLPHRERFANGAVRLQFRIPVAAKGKLLRVHLTIRWQGTTATRDSSFRLR